MATELGSLYYDINIDDKKLKSQLDGADKQVQGFGDRLGSGIMAGSKALLVGVGIAGAAVTAFGVSAVKSFEDSQNQIAQTNAVLKSTGQIAGVTAQAVDDLSKAMQKQTTFSDEEVRSAENLLLTFTSIGKDIFPQATKTVLDMATALGEDTKSASIQLGKALQDPVLGITALRRVGVNFTDKQKDVIQSLVDTGKTAEAQKLILKELNTEFGGSAAAAAQTFQGRLKQLNNSFDDMKEVIGGTIVYALMPLVDNITRFIDESGGAEGVVKKISDAFKEFKPYIEGVAIAIGIGLIPALVALGVSLLMNPVTWYIGIIFALGLGIGKVIDYFGGWDNTLKAMQPTLNAFRQTWEIIAVAFTTYILPALKDIWEQLQYELLPSLQMLWQQLSPVLIPALKALAIVIGATLLVAIVGTLVVIDGLIRVISFLGTVVMNKVDEMKYQFYTLLAVGRYLLDGTIANFNSFIGFFQQLPGRIQGAISGIGGWLYGAGQSLIQGLINGINSKFGDVKGTLGNLTKNIAAWKGPESVDKTLLTKNAETIMTGFVTGLESQYDMVRSSLGGFTNSLGGAISPSINLAGSSGLAGSGSTTKYGDTNINIGTIQDRSDADHLIRQLDRQQQLASMGMTP